MDLLQITLPVPSHRDFCDKKLNPNDSFIIPPMTVLDVGKYITMMDNKSMGHDNNPFLLKLALPYIVEPLTNIYIYINYLFLTTSSQLP